MQILAFLFHFPPISGGGPVVSFEITNTLANLDHDVTILVPDVEWTNQRYDPPLHPRINLIRVETPSRSNLKLAARLCKQNLEEKGKKLCAEKNFDLIFTIFHPFHLVPNAAVSCAKKFNKPIIVKIDDAVYEKSTGLKAIQRRLEKRISTKSLRGATEILVLNETMKKTVHSYYKIESEKISIMPNGIDLSQFVQRKLAREKIVIFSGVMYYHRGLDLLLEAAPKIRKNLPEVKFILFGEGPEMEHLRYIVSKNKLEDSVEFKGWAERDTVLQHLSNASIGIGPLNLTPLTTKSIPVKVLEYMASSLPVIARTGTLSDDVLIDGENGYFISNADELADKIVSLLQNSQLVERMGAKSQDMVKKFSWENLLKPILKKYQID